MLEINEKDAQQLIDYTDSGIEEDVVKQKYPALQLNQYKGLQPNTPLFWCFAEESLKLIPEDLKSSFALEKSTAYFKDDSDEPSSVHKIMADLRFIPLAIPRLFKESKHTKEITKLSKFEVGDRTIAKLFLAAIVENQLLLNSEGLPIVVTLKLRSFRTEEIIGKSDTEEGTLKKLSSELSKKGLGGNGKSNIHFVNLKITPTTKVYKNKDGESNRGVTYKLEAARLNSPEVMAIISKVFTDDLKKDILDPFGLDNPAKTGVVPEDHARNAIKTEIATIAQELGWNNNQIKQCIKEQFGCSNSAECSLEQLLILKTYMEGLASLPYDYSDESEEVF